MASIAPPPWVDELAFGGDGPPWLTMGLSRVDEAVWLLVDEQRPEEIDLRRRLLADRHDDVFAAAPGTEAPGAEVLALVRSWFGRHHPEVALEQPVVGVHPLEQAGRLTQEDLVLMVPRDGRHHLDAACLCFPSHWRLADKLGGSAAAIHDPVPGYADDLAGRVDRYLERLRPGVVSQRRNWSVHDRPDLYAPFPGEAEPVSSDEVATRLWLRSERQTLRRLERTDAVLFTIRVQSAPFGMLAGHPTARTALHHRLRAQPDELTAMNGLTPHRDAVLDWLDSPTA